jgi:hypothetical protein
MPMKVYLESYNPPWLDEPLWDEDAYDDGSEDDEREAAE